MRLLHVVLLQDWCLLQTLTREGHPAVQRRRTFLAPAAGFDPHGISCFLDHVSQASFLFDQKSGKAHSMSGCSVVSDRAVFFLFTRLTPRSIDRHCLVGRPCIEHGWRDGSPRTRASLGHGLFNLSGASPRKLRPKQSNCTGDEGRCDARSTRSLGLSIGAEAGDVFSRSGQSPSADGLSQIRLGCRFTFKIATCNSDHPGMTSDRGTADRSLVASRSYHQDPTLRGVIERLFQLAFASR